MSETPEAGEQKPPIGRTCCLSVVVCLAGAMILLIFAVPAFQERSRKEQVDRQIADVKAGRTRCIYHPDPRFL